MISGLLFNKYDIYSVLENQKRQLRNTARSAPASWTNDSEDVVLDRLVKQFEIEVPQLHEDGMEVSQREIDVDVSRDPFRFIPDPSRPFYIKGIRITFHIPFSGDAGLFDVQPSSFTLSPPRGDVVGNEIQLAYDVTPDRAAGVKATADGEIAKIKGYLNNLRPSAEQLRTELQALARAEWQARKKSFADRENLISSLNLPIRKTQAPPVSRINRG